MLHLRRSLLLIHCVLVWSIYGDCPGVRECMDCLGFTECVVSADNKRVECTTPPSCERSTCTSPSSSYTCVTQWSRSTSTDPWTYVSSCISAGTSDLCDLNETTCFHQFDDSSSPDSVATGSFFCQCRGSHCNQRFIADATPPVLIEPSQPTGSGSSTVVEESVASSAVMPKPTGSGSSTVIEESVASSAVMPTPTVEFNERDCISCTAATPNCTVSEDNRSMKCFVDDNCVNNVIRCSSTARERCTATWFRNSVSSPWTVNSGCLGGVQIDQPTCLVLEDSFRLLRRPVPDSVETGFFVCTCLGALCNREFAVNLDNFTSIVTSSAEVTLSTSTSITPIVAEVRNTSTLTSAFITTTVTMNTTTSATSTTTTSTRTVAGVPGSVHTDGLSGNDIIAISVTVTVVFCLIMLMIFIIGVCYYTHVHHRTYKVAQTGDIPEAAFGLQETLSQLPVEPLEIVGNGRFGTVWKAKLHEELVACKILSFKETKSWENERRLYALPSTAHPNILEYIGSDQKGQGYEAQYLMVLKYYPLGTLTSYLKAHTLHWTQACNFINSALAGVAHLHAESYCDSEGISHEKIPIAHRDIKSSNFLVKSDSGECVLSDLGLSLQLNPNMDVSQLASIGQVGTYRYMSPEALDAIINLQDPESFKQIDMYALALVLWEIASRCHVHEGDTVPEYILPFSREVGDRANPTLDMMRSAVVHGKKRPKIPESWNNHEGLSVLAETLPECWDQEPEARLTATGVLLRLEQFLEVNEPGRRKITVRSQGKASTSSCESGSCGQTIITEEASRKISSSTEGPGEASKTNCISSSDEVTVEASEIANYNNIAEEVTVEANEIQ